MRCRQFLMFRFAEKNMRVSGRIISRRDDWWKFEIQWRNKYRGKMEDKRLEDLWIPKFHIISIGIVYFKNIIMNKKLTLAY